MDRFGWCSDGKRTVGQVFYDSRASPDNATLTDVNRLNDAGASANMRSLANHDFATDGDPRSNMAMVSNFAVMIDGRSRVDYSIAANDGPGLYHGAGHDLNSVTDFNRFCNCGRRVNYACECKPMLRKSLIYLFPPDWLADRTHSIGQLNVLQIKIQNQLVGPFDQNPIYGLTIELRSNLGTEQYFAAHQLQAIDQHPRVPARANDDYGRKIGIVVATQER